MKHYCCCRLALLACWMSGAAMVGEAADHRPRTHEVAVAQANRGGVRALDVRTSEVVMDNPGGLALDLSGGKMYWTDYLGGVIRRANLDGSAVEDLITSGLVNPHGLALDIAAGKMYWTDVGAQTIQRSNLDGTGIQNVTPSGVSFPIGLAIDLVSGKLYWVDAGTDKIKRMDLNGSNVEDVVTMISPNNVAIDPGAGRVYWTDFSSGIVRANFDGSDITQIASSFRPFALALDLDAGFVYWTSGVNPYFINRVGLKGGSVETLPIFDLHRPSGIAVDSANQKIYWADGIGCTAKLRRANGDGSDVEVLVRGPCNPLQVSCMPIGGPTVTGGQTVDVECFVSSEVAQDYVFTELDFACSLPGESGSTGSIDALEIIMDPDGNKKHDPSSGGIPYLFGIYGCCTYPELPPGCAIEGRLFLGSTVIIPAQEVRYLGTIRYQVSDCAAGDFAVVLENFSDPPDPADETGFAGEETLLPFDFTPVVLTATPRPFGDVVRNGVVDVDDLLCLLSAFVNLPDCPTADVTSPATPCTGEGLIDVDDILAVLDAFSGLAPCPGPCGP